MNSRERFLQTMCGGRPDRVPYFEEGLRDEVLEAWRAQGFDPQKLADLPADRREEIQPPLEPLPAPDRWPTTVEEVEAFRPRLDPSDPRQLPKGWPERIREWRDREHVIMLRVHRGFFLSVGVYGWDRLLEVVYLLRDDPEAVHRLMACHADLAAAMAERVLSEIEVDAVIFSEPIGGNDAPLLSPHDYELFALSSYEPVLDVCRAHGVETIILRTYANVRLLIPSLLARGFTCLWACEAAGGEMDYRTLRRELGPDLRLIGGIDLDVLRSGADAIRRELEENVPPLLAQGGYLPPADGRVREDVPWESYLLYRRLLANIITGGY